MRYDFDALQTFVEVLNRGSFSAAAAHLRISKSIASRRVTELEERLQVRLLTRSTRGLAPTDAGRVFHERCRVLLKGLEDAWAEAGDDSAVLTGRLRLTAPTSLEDLLIAPVVSTLMQKHSGLTFDIILSDQRVDLVAQDVDLAIRGGPLGDSTHVARRLALVPAVIVASPAYLGTYGEPVHPEDLVNHVFVEHSEISLQRLWRHDADRARAPARMRQQLQINSFNLLLDLALSGSGLCALPLVQAARAIADGKLDVVLKDHPLAELPLWAVFASARHPPRRLRVLIDALAAYASRPLVDWGLPASDRYDT